MATSKQRRRTYLRRRAHALRLDRRGWVDCSAVGWFPSVDHLAADVTRAMVEIGRMVHPVLTVHPSLAKAAITRQHERALEDLRRSYEIGDPTSFVKITEVP